MMTLPSDDYLFRAPLSPSGKCPSPIALEAEADRLMQHRYVEKLSIGVLRVCIA